jgi:heat shock protein HslJ
MKRYLLLMLPLALAACTKPAQEPAAVAPAEPAAAATPAAATPAVETGASLPAYHWQLTDARTADGKRIDGLFVRAGSPLQLDFIDGRLAVSNSCNRMSGGYTLTGDQLTLTQMASTMMACSDPALMALDRELGKRLEGTSTLVLQAGEAPVLTLTGAAADVLTFTGAPTPETRFGGPGEIAFLEVGPQAKPCNHPLIPNMQCLQVREIKFGEDGIRTGSPGEFQPLYQDIEGFTHQAGTRNVVRVKRFTIANPPADGSSIAYVLDMGVESETVK